MKIVDNINQFIIIPEGRFSNILSVIGNCKLDPESMRLFAESLVYVDRQIDRENLRSVPKRINVLFVKDFNLSFVENGDDSNTCGMQFNAIIYSIDRIQKLENERLKIFVFIEELAHCIWNITDETEVKYKTIEILRNSNYKITWEDVQKWKLNLK